MLNQHSTSPMGVGGRARRRCRASDLQWAASGCRLARIIPLCRHFAPGARCGSSGTSTLRVRTIDAPSCTVRDRGKTGERHLLLVDRRRVRRPRDGWCKLARIISPCRQFAPGARCGFSGTSTLRVRTIDKPACTVRDRGKTGERHLLLVDRRRVRRPRRGRQLA